MDVLLTGGSGFVGSCVAKRLLDEGYRVTAAVRGSDTRFDARIESWRFEDLSADQDWGARLRGKA